MSETAGEAPLDGAAFDALPGTEHAVDLPEGMQSPDTRPEMVRHPDHYGGDTTYEVIKCLEAWGLDADAYLFNVVKYVARAGKKGSVIEDLKKAEFYLQRKIKNLEAQQ